jgi:protoporphyrin/coproporphyrin ferrochelatase
MITGRQGILLISFGGPRSSEEVRPFLDDVLAGHPVPRERYEQVVRQYERLGGMSPLPAAVERFEQSMKRYFKERGRDTPIYTGMRHGSPALADTLAGLAADGITEATVVILSSFRSEPSWDRYVAALENAQRRAGTSIRFRYPESWSEDRLFIQAVTDRILEAQSVLPAARQKSAFWIFTAHSIPVPADAASGYARRLTRSAELAAARLDREPSDWTLAYQSRSGRPQDPWLEPDVAAVLNGLPGAGRKDVLVIPLGFLVENAEIAFDLDVTAREAAEAAGLNFIRARPVADHPALLEIFYRETAGPVEKVNT